MTCPADLAPRSNGRVRTGRDPGSRRPRNCARSSARPARRPKRRAGNSRSWRRSRRSPSARPPAARGRGSRGRRYRAGTRRRYPRPCVPRPGSGDCRRGSRCLAGSPREVPRDRVRARPLLPGQAPPSARRDRGIEQGASRSPGVRDPIIAGDCGTFMLRSRHAFGNPAQEGFRRLAANFPTARPRRAGARGRRAGQEWRRDRQAPRPRASQASPSPRKAAAGGHATGRSRAPPRG